MLKSSISILGALALVTLAGCPASTVVPGRPCDTDEDCLPGERCVGGGVGCMGPDGGGGDAGPRRDAGPCTDAADCDDDVFCNGTEACTAGSCVVGTPPCAAAMCNETTDTCRTTDVDADGDGDPSSTDCDDDDGLRFHGNIAETNRCDEIDNDCDPETLGPDVDRDGFGALGCCNPQVDGTLACGDDCDDTRDTVNPDALESCNEADDNCDGTVDELVETSFYRDLDNDGYGRMLESVTGCVAPLGYVPLGTDCDDERGVINPAAAEICNGGVDDNCDGEVDLDTETGLTCDCPNGMSRTCGPMDGTGGPLTLGDCRQGTQLCVGGRWADCVGAVFPTTDAATGNPREASCDVHDEDCDGVVNDDPPPPDTSCYDGPAGTASVGICRRGTYVCPTTSGWVCMGQIVPMSSATVQCGTDSDCDGDRYENIACEPAYTGHTADTRSCNDTTCGGAAGSQTCGASCTYPPLGDCVRSGGRTCLPGAAVSPGSCRSCGSQTCQSDCRPGGACSYPTETCASTGPMIDEDCDTRTDEGVRANCCRDFDMDSFRSTTTGPTSVCLSAGACPTGWVDCSRPGDCADMNPQVSANCLLPNHYTTTPLNQCCHWSCPNPQSMSFTGACPPGYRVYMAEPVRLDGGGGSCSAYGSPSGVTVETACIGFEGTSCAASVWCQAYGI